MSLNQYITKTGMELLQKRINFLMNEDRPEMLKSLVHAREMGDLSENAEYKAARERQRSIDSEIDHLRRRSAGLKVIDTDVFPRDMVRFGLYCNTLDLETEVTQWYHVVGVDELNYHAEEGIMCVSVAAPVGSALLGKKIGEVAVVKAPMGERKLKIMEIR